MSDLSSAAPLTSLIDEHYELIYRYAYRLSGQQSDAEDLTQQTFLAAQQHWSQLRNPEAARGWLCSIVRNAWLQGKRSTQASVSLPEILPEKPAEVAEFPGDLDGADLQEALNTLPEEFRSPLILFYLQELSYKEIAIALEVPPGTVMSRLSRGKSLLRQRLVTVVQQRTTPASPQRPAVLMKKSS